MNYFLFQNDRNVSGGMDGRNAEGTYMPFDILLITGEVIYSRGSFILSICARPHARANPKKILNTFALLFARSSGPNGRRGGEPFISIEKVLSQT